MIDPNYRQKVHSFLEKLPKDNVVILSEKVSPETYDQFIECCRDYMDAFDYGGFIEFNSDYSKLRKIDDRFIRTSF